MLRSRFRFLSLPFARSVDSGLNLVDGEVDGEVGFSRPKELNELLRFALKAGVAPVKS